MEVYNYPSYNRLQQYVQALFLNTLKEKNLDEYLLSQILADFAAYSRIKHGKNWENKLLTKIDTDEQKIGARLNEWLSFWLIKWQQRATLVSQQLKSPPENEHALQLTKKEKEGLLRYLREALVRRGEIAGINMIAEGTLKQTLIEFGSTGKTEASKTDLLRITSELHFQLNQLLVPSRKLFFIPIKENLRKKRYGR